MSDDITKISVEQAEKMLKNTGGCLAYTDIEWILKHWYKLGYVKENIEEIKWNLEL